MEDQETGRMAVVPLDHNYPASFVSCDPVPATLLEQAVGRLAVARSKP
jgi:hypothetical protein